MWYIALGPQDKVSISHKRTIQCISGGDKSRQLLYIDCGTQYHPVNGLFNVEHPESIIKGLLALV
jgi:hypothetical protein